MSKHFPQSTPKWGVFLKPLAAVLLTTLTIVTGCSILPDKPRSPIRYFTVEPIQCAQSATPEVSDDWLRVDRVWSDPALESTKIMYTRSELERGFYQYSFWIAPPSNLFERVVRSELQCNPLGQGSETRALLRIHLLEFMHDAKSKPGIAQVAALLQLRGPSRGEEIGSTIIRTQEPVTDYSAEGAVAALNIATRAAAVQTREWIASRIAESK